MNDIRYAIRLLRKAPLFTATVVLLAAVGIGATTAIFSIVNAVLLRPLPFAQPDRLMQVAEKNDALHLPIFGASALNYLSWKKQTRSFEALGGVQFTTFTLSGRGEPENYTGSLVSPSLMPLLGLTPIAGRSFREGEDKPGAAPAAMISEAVWRRRFGADPSIVGRPVTLNSTSFTIVGVAPRALTTLTTGEVFAPLVIDPPNEKRLNHVLFVVGRLAPGVTMRQGQAEMDAIAARMQRQYTEMKDWGVTVVTFTDTFVSSQLRTSLLVLLGGVVFVLLIVSANVANLLLARSLERRKEMAVRCALGAGRGQLVRQLLIESLLLSALGGAAGVAAATWAVWLLQASLPANLLPVPDIGVDRTVVLFAVAMTIVTGVAFGLAPAWNSARVDVNTVLKDAGRSSTASARPGFRKALAAAELALAAMLLVGAALLVRSLFALQRVPLGFDPSGVLSFQLSLPAGKYPNAQRAAFFRELAARLRALPGVSTAAMSTAVPFGAGTPTMSPFSADGSTKIPAGTSMPIDWRSVGPGYFATLGVPLLRGRDFTDTDIDGAPDVMIVSRATARAFWGDEDPVGRVIHKAADPRRYVVVGVVGDVRSRSLDRESPTLYFSAGMRTFPLMDVAVRPRGNPALLMGDVRAVVRSMDPDLAVSNVRPLTEWVLTSAAQPRLSAVLLTAFACAALLVAAVGTYGVLAYSVSQRTKELGLRIALGADRRGVLTLVLREGLTVGLCGLGLGVTAAAGLAQVLSALVFDVSVHDPATYAGVSVVLVLIACAACSIPAIKASRVDPMTALRLD